ncbi:GNAT family N-acetyltransferase [Bacillus sp. FJAT-50079]|uniref:GNAT family N-acetyltransferase n=1 Tax=Bacillus sp. FJAT-50079 TaxID=2833577 RepID=UPI001BCA21CA|nr:GNAT family N-acetyltransferase [Bacillus sp. FJAT-50079]MBS4208852.1 GNAT family N-acetyltransferase [Bacillus sp. FJAT-50079]
MEKCEYVQLRHFSNVYSDILNSFELPNEQGKFTSLPKEFQEHVEDQYRIVILHKSEPVGFFILHATDRVKDYTENSKAMLLTSLSINHVHQGKGFAKQAMFLLKKFISIEFPTCNEVVLAVNHKNNVAQQLYVKVGFQDTGKRKIGPIGEQFIMKLMIQ